MPDNNFLEDLCDALELELGGPAELARHIAHDYKEAPVGSPTRLRAGLAIIDLYRDLGQSEDGDDLDALRERYAEELEREQPDAGDGD